MSDQQKAPKLQQLLDKALKDALEAPVWPKEYRNRDTGRVYTWRNQDEYEFVFGTEPRYWLVTGGEGSGKSVSGIIKTIHKLRHGMSGVMVSPNLPHFARSLWPEFRRWFPWEMAVQEHQHMGAPSWSPYRAFTLVVRNELGTTSFLICGGIEKPLNFEGPNLHFAYVDEMRGCESDEVIKVLTGRARLRGPRGEPPQFYSTSTPRMHFMYDYFGPVQEEDEYAEFKARSKRIVFTTQQAMEAGFVDEDYVESRGSSLTEAQKRVRLFGEWEDEETPNLFLESISMWDRLQQPVPSLDQSTSVVLAVDGAVTRDHFAIVGVSRDPANSEDMLVRLVKVWVPPKNGKIDFMGTEENPGPELFLRDFCANHNVVTIVYDRTQLHDMMSRLMRDGVAWCQEFSQMTPRTVADQMLYDYILQGRIHHDGNGTLREHIQNAGASVDDGGRKRRIVKIRARKKIDAAVALSMAVYECARLNIT